jgi:hypothetical protein
LINSKTRLIYGRYTYLTYLRKNKNLAFNDIRYLIFIKLNSLI